MANRLFDNYKNLLGGAGTHALPDMDGGNIKATLIDIADDDPDSAVDQDFADIVAAARVASVALAAKSFGVVAAGRFDSSDPTFTSVSGDQAEEIILWEDTTVEGTSPLIAIYDTFSSGMPVTPNGGDITVVVNASGWFGF